MANLEAQLRYKKGIDNVEWPQDNEYKNLVGQHLIQECGRDLVSVSHAAMQLCKTVNMFLENKYCDEQIWEKYQQNGLCKCGRTQSLIVADSH